MRRETFVAEYAALTAAARWTGGRLFFADEARFQADTDLRNKLVLQGVPALVDSSSRDGARRPVTIRRCVWNPAR